MIPIGSLYCYNSKETTTSSCFLIKAVGNIVVYQTSQNKLFFIGTNDSFIIVDYAEDLVFTRRYYCCIVTHFKNSEISSCWFEEQTMGKLVKRSNPVL